MRAPELTFRDYLRIIRKRKWWISVFVIVAPIIALFSTTRQVPIYRAEAIIKISTRAPIVSVTESQVTWYDVSSSIETEMELIKSTKIVEKAARKLGIIKEGVPPLEVAHIVKSLRGKIETEQVKNTDFLILHVKDPNPNLASAFVNGLAEAYIEEHFWEKNRETKATREFLEQQLEERESALGESEDRLRKYKEEHSEFFTLTDGYKRRLADIEQDISHLTEVYTPNYWKIKTLQKEADKIRHNLEGLPGKELELDKIEREMESNKVLCAATQQKLTEVKIVEQGAVQNISLITPAFPPTAPINPSKKINIGMGIVVGLILGLIFAFISESLDTSIATIDEIEGYLGVPVLGVIPTIKEKEDNLATHPPLLIKRLDEKNLFEPWRTLATNIEFALVDKPGKTLIVTSTVPGEGKTINAINTAIMMAHIGKKTLLVDADTGRPSIHKMFNIPRDVGLMELVLDKMELREVMKGISHFVVSGLLKEEQLGQIPGIDNLYIIGGGEPPPNPVEVMKSTKMRKLIEMLKNEFDIIIFDSTPALVSATTSVLASMVDYVILVYHVGMVARGSLKRAVAQLSYAKATVLGVILNKMRAEDLEPGVSYYYKYKYGYKYYHGYYDYAEEKKKRVIIPKIPKFNIAGVGVGVSHLLVTVVTLIFKSCWKFISKRNK